MKFRMGFVSLLLVLLATFATVAFAQDDLLQPCFDLSEEDCTLYYDAQMFLPESTNFSASVDVAVGLDDQSYTATVLAGGGYVADMDVLSQVSDFIALLEATDSAEDLANLTLENVLTNVGTLLMAADADLSLSITLPDELLAEMDGIISNPLDLNLWFVDGIAYADLTPAAVVDPTLAGIFGIDLNEALAFAQLTLTEEQFQDLLSDDDLMAQLEAQLDSQDMLMGELPADIEDAITLTRLDDEDGYAVFETSVDLVTLLSSEFVREQVVTAIESDEDMSAEGTPTADEIVDALIASLTESEIVSYEYIDLESGYYVSTEIYVNTVIDPAPLAALDSGSTEGMPAIITVDVTIVFERSEIDEVAEIPAPADGIVVPFAELIGSLSGSEGQAQ